MERELTRDAPSLPAALQRVLHQADVRIGGHRPWDLQVHDPAAIRMLLASVMRQGSLGLGNTYVNGLWHCQALDQLFTRLLLAQGSRLRSAWWLLRDRLLNLQSLPRATTVGPPPLRHRPRGVCGDARSLAAIQLRLLAAGPHPGPGPGAQAAADLRQA